MDGTLQGPEHESAKDRLFSDVQSVARGDDALQKTYTTRQVIERIWTEHFRPRMKIVAVVVAAMVVSALLTGAVPFFIKTAGDEIFVKHNESMIYTVTIAVIVLTLLKTSSEYLSNVAVNYLGNRFIADMRLLMFERLVRGDLRWIESVHSGRFLASFLNDALQIRQTASRAMIAYGESALKAIVLTVAMFWLDWRLAIIITICLPFGVVLLGRQQRKTNKSTKKSLQETGDLSALIAQTLRSIRVVRAYRQDQKEIDHARDIIDRTLEFTMRGARAKALANPIAELLTGIGLALAILYAGTQGISGQLTLGEFMGFAAAAMLLFQPLRKLALIQTSLQEGVAAASRVFGIIDREAELREIPNAPELKIVSGEINLENVTFAYDEDQPVLRNLSLTIPAGKTVALVGHSGAGKSTVLNLVLRFFDPVSGRVLIDGQDIAKVSIDSLRDATALVTQDPILFDDTIEANIAYGTPDASHDDIVSAAEKSAAHSFISAMPNGYKTNVREAGNALSGGERQRIAIARAILKDAPILMLDEPTSSLDSASEAIIHDALTRLIKGRTVLMIAHRLSTVRHADLICVLKDGQLVESGTHDELWAMDGAYARLCRTQLMLDETDKPAKPQQRLDEVEIVN